MALRNEVSTLRGGTACLHRESFDSRNEEVHEVKARHLGSTTPTGSFGAFRPARVVGVSDDVRIANRSLVRSARRAERAWLKTLPKGVTV